MESNATLRSILEFNQLKITTAGSKQIKFWQGGVIIYKQILNICVGAKL